MQTELFDIPENIRYPLAYRNRPVNWENFYGQDKVAQRLKNLNKETIPHFVVWGPPGSGKTTLSFILARQVGMEIYNFNAVLSGVPELRKLMTRVIEDRKISGKKSIIFIDEIHRFNKSQQDALLPHLEKGDFVFLGATTEYPQTSLNRALLSRVNILELEKLDNQNLKKILDNVLKKEEISLNEECLNYLIDFSNGDARFALNKIEILKAKFDDLKKITLKEVSTLIEKEARQYDRNSSRHYDVISAFIKSIRGSDVNAAILWLAVMIDGGEDPEFIARRLIILASEDVGNADPRALQLATSVHYAVKNIGMPEARISLAQATTYLALAPKSNASYKAIDAALEYVRKSSTRDVPRHLSNVSQEKKNYKYPHSYKNHWVEQDYGASGLDFYSSSEMGFEKLQNDFHRKLKNNDEVQKYQ
ncbi:MAG: replication-associated recombination protein A [Halobacteriovoraceae bacterium]|nr:replication-associated recombination protein A [Halobacteriovoraceae bacterium]MCB9095173.1 replication-associated recombination protein A [Halobacteriovoraceae bacterium]